VRELLRGLLDLLVPPVCARCGSGTSAPLCRDCLRALPMLGPDRCAGCQQAPPQLPGSLCRGCGAHPSALRACIAGAWFRGDVERYIRGFKYPPRGLAAQDASCLAVARALVCAAGSLVPGGAPDCVVAIPLHARALRRRGFNPAGVLARALALRVGVPLRATALERRRDTPSQTGLGRAARRRNVRGAFRARGALPPRVWLVDDVVTTGATLAAAARALRRAGAREVTGVCAARTPHA
jgi:predicted amidophosphoribosyltransferase